MEEGDSLLNIWNGVEFPLSLEMWGRSFKDQGSSLVEATRGQVPCGWIRFGAHGAGGVTLTSAATVDPLGLTTEDT